MDSIWARKTISPNRTCRIHNRVILSLAESDSNGTGALWHRQMQGFQGVSRD